MEIETLIVQKDISKRAVYAIALLVNIETVMFHQLLYCLARMKTSQTKAEPATQTQSRGLHSTLYNQNQVMYPIYAIGEVDVYYLFLSLTSPAGTDDVVKTEFGRYPTCSSIGIMQKLTTNFVLNIYDAEDFSPLTVKML
ncbi:hypothetical protein KUTeg_005931 [Tegillarca granosa]|uniref:Uncharacterized protein n=1 Tax=Tegillarca granosa TaxID=220873 RepID=A0ABQ9FGU7_TEGGR|nr:hypothetical protein KUTeg_005931 [Tegillarca granosa]